MTDQQKPSEQKPKIRVATVWLDGCSGCHMSFLDIDERLLALAERIQVVYSPLVDRKDFPPEVDLTLVEGAVSSEEDLHKIQHIRKRTKFLIALGDCAVTANVPGMRNPYPVKDIMTRAYDETATLKAVSGFDATKVPPLLRKTVPVHHVVKVDLFVQGCPPPADVIYHAIAELLEGRTPVLTPMTRFGR